jgi:hypothetical protein
MPRDEIVVTPNLHRQIERMGDAMVRCEPGTSYYALAAAALAALIEERPLVAGLIDDPKGIAGAVAHVLDDLHDAADQAGWGMDQTRRVYAHVATVSAWLTGAGESTDGE